MMIVIQLIDDEGIGTMVTVIEPKNEPPRKMSAPVEVPQVEPQIIPAIPIKRQ